MTSEAEFVAALRAIAVHPAARALRDDAAVLPAPAGRDLVLTHDMLVEGVHYLPDDPAEDVAWKLVAVNLSDLAAKGAAPLGALLGYALGGERGWDTRFVTGLGHALAAFDVPLLGGDTVAMPAGAPRALGLTAIGRVPPGGAPARGGARPGDALWVTGTIGRAGLGLRGRGGAEAAAAYRRPVPRLAEGRALAPHVTAMMDVSDGLLIDAGRIAAASGLALAIDLDAVPVAGERMAALTAGDDYELLFAAAAGFAPPVAATRIGAFGAGEGLSLHDAAGPVPLPPVLGWEH